MIKEIVKDTFFLAQKSEEATEADLYLATDLQDTLNANRENCVGMAANMITKTCHHCEYGLGDLVMFNPLFNKWLPLIQRNQAFWWSMFDTLLSC